MRLGADPEVFLLTPKGRPISVIGMVGADKWHPKQIPFLPEGFTIQEDNVALEFGIPPAASADEFAANIRTVMDNSLGFLRKGVQFSKESCISFPDSQLRDPAALRFGCEPDYNAWKGQEVNRKPIASDQNLRSAGGHIHVETKYAPAKVVQLLDLFLAVPSTLMDEAGTKRRELYGKIGANRPKPYGVEYRVLSNYWIFDDNLIRWAWRSTERALSVLKQNPKIDLSPEYDNIRAAVNNGDKAKATELIQRYDLEVI